MFYDIKKHKYLSNIDSTTINSEILQKECLILPSFPELTKSQINFICNKIKNFIKQNL
jgi:dTDP-4-amino-4,6-dideoxygalactose transaminase